MLVFLRKNTRKPEFTKKGEIHELRVLALSLVWFAGATPATSVFVNPVLRYLPESSRAPLSLVSDPCGFSSGHSREKPEILTT